MDWHLNTAEKIAKYPSFWEDSLRGNPQRSYLQIFCDPNNLILDMNNAGVAAFQRSGNGTKCILYSVSWGKGAANIPTARREAGRIALQLLNVYRCEAITAFDNEKARKAMEDCGMTYISRLPGGLCYNGVVTDGVLYEADRISVGLDPL